MKRNQLDLELYEYAKSLVFKELLEDALDRETMVPETGNHTSEIHDLLARVTPGNQASNSSPENQEKVTLSPSLPPKRDKATVSSSLPKNMKTIKKP